MVSDEVGTEMPGVLRMDPIATGTSVAGGYAVDGLAPGEGGGQMRSGPLEALLEGGAVVDADRTFVKGHRRYLIDGKGALPQHNNFGHHTAPRCTSQRLAGHNRLVNILCIGLIRYPCLLRLLEKVGDPEQNMALPFSVILAHVRAAGEELHEDIKNARLTLVQAVRIVLKNGLDVLNIKAINKM